MRRVLIVDDDRIFADAVQEELEREGYLVDVVHDPAALAARLAGDPVHVVLLDVRLSGPGGLGTDGVALAPDILRSWPSSRIVVVSGFVTQEVVRRAYQAGAVDILRKDEVLSEMLRFKVRRAADDAERDLAADPAQRERALRESWQELGRETDRHRKGVALERVTSLLLTSIAGLLSRQRVTNGMEEFDLVVANCSVHPFLAQQGPVWLVECKNWTVPTGVPALRPLLDKMRNRRCRLGLAVSLNGFASTVEEDLLRESQGDLLVVLIDGAALAEWIDAPDRAQWLVDRILRATTR